MKRMTNALPIFLLLAVSLLMFAGCSSYEYNGTVYDPPMPAAEVTGTNWDGSEFRMSDLQGKVALVFFGYTSCPDICPLTLANMTQVYTLLGDKAEDVAVVFISVDPDRDTPEQLAQYIPAFNNAFYGVYIPEPALDQTKQDYFVYAEKNYPKDSQSSLDYLIDHTGWIYAIDRKGDMRLVFEHDAPPDEIAADVEHLLTERK